MVKNPPTMRADAGSVPGLGRSPGGEVGSPLQRSYLESCSPLGPRESETTEHAHLEAPSPQTDISGVAASTREFGEGETQLSPEQTSSSPGVSPFLSI